MPNATFLAFTGTPISKDDRDTQYIFSLSELNALNSSSEVTLRFKPTSEVAYNAEISATAWMRPFGSSENHYHGGRVENVKPGLVLKQIAKPLYKTADSINQKRF